MKITVERNSSVISESLEKVLGLIPMKAAGQVRDYIDIHGEECLNEIRLRADRRASITADGKNHIIDTVCTMKEIGETVTLLCDGSVYAHSDTICDGYITYNKGYRAGISGHAAMDKGNLIGIRDVTSVNIRIPHRIRGAGKEIYSLFRDSGYSEGILIYSAPGAGKTTILRELCAMISSGENPLRTAAVDTRCELSFGFDGDESCTLDFMTGYPRAKGIEIASRTMNEQVIICDEIGSREEAEAIIEAQNTGVPLIASAHAPDFESLMRRGYIKQLIDSGVFEYAVGISRLPGKSVYSYDIHYMNRE